MFQRISRLKLFNLSALEALQSVIVVKKIAIAGGVILGILLISFLIVLRYVGIGIFSLRQ